MQSIIFSKIFFSFYLIFMAISICNEARNGIMPIDRRVDITKTTKESEVRRFWGKEIQGKVIKIADGDTFTMIFDNDFDVRVRLNGIDCPEKSQPFSKRAKQALSDFIFGKMVVVQYKEKDRYGRVIGDVYIDGLHVNYEMVKLGLAWHFKRYSDDEELNSLEKDARYKRIGLWSDKKPIPPWEWRKGIRELKE
jgi:micrococcal nuclease